jgi:putative ABC transport system permease protein
MLAIFISSIGLFSMAMLVSSARMREIGVRKTLGASTSSIVSLLLNIFSKPVVAANLVAWPIAYVAARAYLAPFIYPIQITPFPFVACLVTTVVVSWGVVAGQTWRAASQKPADILRAE